MRIPVDTAAWIEAKLAELDFVQWDRFVAMAYEDADHGFYLDAYGWIERECDSCDGTAELDGPLGIVPCVTCEGTGASERADFVLLNFRWGCKVEGWPERGVGATTSSAEHSARIHELVHGQECEHVECCRVEDHFPELANAVRLRKPITDLNRPASRNVEGL